MFHPSCLLTLIIISLSFLFAVYKMLVALCGPFSPRSSRSHRISIPLPVIRIQYYYRRPVCNGNDTSNTFRTVALKVGREERTHPHRHSNARPLLQLTNLRQLSPWEAASRSSTQLSHYNTEPKISFQWIYVLSKDNTIILTNEHWQ
jgi:hypothetical protein